MDNRRSSTPENSAEHHPVGKTDSPPRNKSGTTDNPTGQVDIIAMVRSLQRTAGLADCFRSGDADCDRVDCDWRFYCLGKTTDPKKTGRNPDKEDR